LQQVLQHCFLLVLKASDLWDEGIYYASSDMPSAGDWILLVVQFVFSKRAESAESAPPSRSVTL
jgi:hypothetical protein